MRRFSIFGTALLTVALLLVSTSSAVPPPIRVDVPPTTEATSLSATSVTYHVKAYDTSVAAQPEITATCPGGSGSGDFYVTADFPYGETSGECTATLSDGVTPTSTPVVIRVVDTTPPSFSSVSSVTDSTTDPTGKVVSFATPTATDLGEPVAVSCSPASGSKFAIGTTQVDCSANDGRSPTPGHAFFNVTVTLTDDQAPTFTPPLPSSSTTEATGPGGAAVSWAIAATDNADPNPTINCAPTSGSTFAITTTTVTCTASDSSGNTSPPITFDVTVTDTTKPTLTVPSNQRVETENPGGVAVTYSASASDIVDGTISPSCSPASGTTFAIGTTPVHCTATDRHGNASSGDFNVTVTLADHTPPVLSNYADKTVEANGPGGSVVNYSTPTAVDALDGPIGVVSCAPGSGTTFPLGTTAVNCSATDSHGNVGHASFNVTVEDTTGPNLIVPAGRSVYATTATGVPNTVSGVVAFLSAASATDIVDPNPVISTDAPAFFPVGPNTVDFFAKDASGNVTSRQSTLVVLPEPLQGTPPLPIPPPPGIPAEVKNVRFTPLDRAVRIQWDAGGRTVEVIRSTSSTGSLSAVGDERVVYKGTASSYTDRGLQNGVEVRYVVRALDAAGNHSAGVAGVVVPRRDLLKSPKDGARLKKAPKLVWAVDAEAQYYNAQLMLNGVKILSVWPLRPAYALKKTWKYNGRKYTLQPGLYTWFIWPGYGTRSAVDYGTIMGSRTFRIVR
ncbi:MAG: HYR domain-containing protein [Actinobacteria bacterium]|nr:HYR domain-containing protein [Actinomycetota bacterium]